MKRRIFIKQMTPAEAGDTKTHEKYIRLPNGFDYEAFFQQKGVVNESVIQVDFNAAYNGDTNSMIPMKFVFYANSNHEKRIPSLGPIFDKYNVIADDVIWLESITDNGLTTFTVSFKKSSAVKLYTSPIFYEIDENEQDKAASSSFVADKSLQQIFYGAPGTGKSYTINQDTKGEDVVRTTFHPDSDYSTFVGAYKPTTKSVKLRDMSGHVVKDEVTNQPVEEDRIVYEFVEQAFLKAYTKAWLNYAKAEEGSEPKKEYLVIEEINRGNCAQIFGDLFQLLDRNAAGYSDYPIQADKDMQKQLQKAFKGVSIPQAERINDMYDGKDVVGQVLNGDILLLPNNLYIWATMNTSDQSLFPIDSAFKRRWDWTYVPISDAKKGYTIKVSGALYDWWQFLEKINHKIGETTNSEDKKLGYFFCKADDNGEISAEKFVGKVIFYLWNDVFKDYEFGDAIFNDEDGTKLTFDKFHVAAGRKSEIVESKVQLFLKNLGLEPSASVDDGLEDSEDSSIPEIKAARREYWDAFLRYAEGNEAFVKCFGEGRTAGASHSTDFSINHPDCHLVVTQSRQKKGLSVSLYFDKTTENYYRLEAKKDEIEQELQIKFEWNEMPDNKASIIRETRNDIAYDDHAQWSVQFDFIIDRMLRMRETFLKYLN